MVRSAEKRITTYGNKIDADVIRSRFSALKTTMVESASVKQAEIAQLQADVKNKLEELGIPAEFTVGFMKIAMYLYGLKNKHAGAMLTVEAQAYISAQATKLYAFVKSGSIVKNYLEWVLAYFGITGVTVPNPPAGS
jgi:hypothetical protein